MSEKPLDYSEIIGALRAAPNDPTKGIGELLSYCPEAADAIAELVAENERLRADNEYQRCIMETMREHIGKLAQCIPNPKD